MLQTICLAFSAMAEKSGSSGSEEEHTHDTRGWFVKSFPWSFLMVFSPYLPTHLPSAELCKLSRSDTSKV